MITETIYIGDHNNSIDLILEARKPPATVATPLTDDQMDGISKMTLTIGDALIVSENGSADLIRWRGTDFETGEIRMTLGGAEGLMAGTATGYLAVYSGSDTESTIWCSIPLRILAEVEKEEETP